jgi:hypothetical protein
MRAKIFLIITVITGALVVIASLLTLISILQSWDTYREIFSGATGFLTLIFIAFLGFYVHEIREIGKQTKEIEENNKELVERIKELEEKQKPREDGRVLMENLLYDPAKGDVRNIANGGNERQVVLRVRTFNNILSSIWKYINKHVEGDIEEKKSFFKEAIYSSGRNCGWDFADRNYDNFIRNRDVGNDINKLIKKWCEFDTQVGFGILELVRECNPAYHENGVKTLKCEISIHNNFVTEEIESSEFCCFIRGYCEGVLKYFARKSGYGDKCKIKFDCIKDNYCKREGHSGEKCEYTVMGNKNLSYEKKRWKIEEKTLITQ